MPRKKNAKKSAPRKSTAKQSTRKATKEKVSRVIDQVKEPLSLLSTLREEGLANVMSLLTIASTVASGASRNLRLDSVRSQLKEVISSLGFALHEDVEKLESRIEELELKLSEKEYADLRASDEE
jgi:polyhydroxyalkanoate synthesis regulator phasin